MNGVARPRRCRLQSDSRSPPRIFGGIRDEFVHDERDGDCPIDCDLEAPRDLHADFAAGRTYRDVIAQLGQVARQRESPEPFGSVEPPMSTSDRSHSTRRSRSCVCTGLALEKWRGPNDAGGPRCHSRDALRKSLRPRPFGWFRRADVPQREIAADLGVGLSTSGTLGWLQSRSRDRSPAGRSSGRPGGGTEAVTSRERRSSARNGTSPKRWPPLFSAKEGSR